MFALYETRGMIILYYSTPVLLFIGFPSKRIFFTLQTWTQFVQYKKYKISKFGFWDVLLSLEYMCSNQVESQEQQHSQVK